MRLLSVLFICFVALASAKVYFNDDFSNADWESRWVVSDWKKDSSEAGSWKLTAGKFFDDEEKDQGLQTADNARFYAISSEIKEAFSNKGKTLVVSYSVKHEQKLTCGGGYIKLLPGPIEQKNFQGGASESKYNLMFGPDICGSSTRKVHVILNKDGKNHLIKKNIAAESDELSHTYTLVLNPDNTFEVYVDGNKKESGAIDHEDNFDILPPKKIKDPSQSKPADWVDERLINDASDVKPDGYDNIPAEVSDPDATKPDDWDDELDGEWEAPKIANPDYKGPWAPKKIENPEYKGEWVHPEIDNPEFNENNELYAFDEFKFVGIDIWQVEAGSIFSNFLITDSFDEVKSSIDEVNKLREVEKSKKEKVEEEERKVREAEEKAKQAEAAENEAEGSENVDVNVDEPKEEKEDL